MVLRGQRFDRRLLGLLVAALAAVMLAACGASNSSSNSASAAKGGRASASSGMIRVKLSSPPIGDAAPIWVAQQEGFYKQNGLNVVPGAATTSSQALVPLLQTEAVDIGVAGIPTLLQAKAQHLGVTVVAGLSRFGTTPATDSGGLVVSASSSIHSVAQLNGKSVGVSGLKGGATIDVSLISDTQGGSSKTLHFIAAPPPVLPGLVASGHVTAALLQEPFLTIGLKQDHLRLLAHGTMTPPNGGTSAVVLAASSRWASSNPGAVTRLQKAISEAVAWSNNPANRKQLIAIMAAHTHTPSAVLSQTILPQFNESVTRATLQPLERLSLRYGVITQPVNVDSILAPGA